MMYAPIGGKYVALGDPFGLPDACVDAVREFAAFGRSAGRGSLFYHLGERYAEALRADGWRTIQSGEEAIVRLPGFHTGGKAWLKLRTKQNKLLRDGYRCDVTRADDGSVAWGELQRVSDAWLGRRTEKSFSVGSFSEAAVIDRPVASLRSPEGALLAFVTLAEYRDADGAQHAVVDLMRYLPGSPPGTMEVLFLHALGWAKERGYATCSLGVAPLANAEAMPRYVRPAVALLSKRYNFQGLRHFKSKFHPEWTKRYIAADGCPAWLALAAIGLLVHRRTRPGRTQPSGLYAAAATADSTSLRDS